MSYGGGRAHGRDAPRVLRLGVVVTGLLAVVDAFRFASFARLVVDRSASRSAGAFYYRDEFLMAFKGLGWHGLHQTMHRGVVWS